MNNDFINRLERLGSLIHRRSTGSPKDLAKKLELSERSLYNYINLIRDIGATVKFCQSSNSYYYEEHGRLVMKFIINDYPT
ncbi:HTH domain-containing protein [Pinibacter aurantiacus]|uniref:HTH domain-containing protein n=1 Tax=Pinibacter aurantiacus TaxID=2851599 RepID=A0A9E2S9P5_9BACT|nr:HTH domain-containing protein [Pinibacter aurantiacus]